jgi:hypothetical protein
VSNYEMSWIVKAKLFDGPGTYYVSVRLRDGYGRITPPVSASFQVQ